MIDKVDRRYFSGIDMPSILQSLQGTLYQQGIVLQQVAPNSWSGRGQAPSYGIVPKVGITAMPMQDGVSVDLRVSADLEGNGIVILVIAWLFFFPVAIILIVLGYQDFDRRATQIVAAVWAPLSHKMVGAPVPQWGPPPMGAPPGPPPAGGYGYGGPR